MEFNTTTLSDALKEQFGENSINGWKRDYVKEIPPITCEHIFEFVINATPDSNNLERYGPKLYNVIRQRLVSKSDIRKSENEWRLVVGNNEAKMKILRRNLIANAITAVYLGCRISEQVRIDFICETRRNFPNAKVFQAKMRRGEYAIDFEEIT